MIRRTLSTLLLLPALAGAADFEAVLDRAYGDDGRVAFGFDSADGVRLRGYARSPTSGRVWMFGDAVDDPAALFIARVLPQGDADTGFGPLADGRRRTTLPAGLTPNDEALALAGAIVQDDGKPLVHGALRPLGADIGAFPGLVCRLTVAGTLDAGFGSGGCRLLRSFLSASERCRVTDVAVGVDQAITAIGNCSADDLPEQPFIARLTADGALDTEFGAGAGLLTPAQPAQASAHRYRALALRPAGQAVVVGEVTRILTGEMDQDIGVWQFDGGGSADVAFGGDGFALLDFDVGGDDDDHARDVALRPDGTAVVLGQALRDDPRRRVALLAQLLPDGAPDPGFGANGRRIEALDGALDAAAGFNSLELDADGRLVIGGARATGEPQAAPRTGTEFRFALPRGVPPESNVRLLITSDVFALGLVYSESQDVFIPFETEPGEVTVVELGADLAEIAANGTVSDKTVRIASGPITVQAFAGKGLTATAYTVLPIAQLGRDYRVATWGEGLGVGSQLAVTAVDPGATRVTITPSTAAAGHPADVPFDIVLQQGEVYHLDADAVHGDLTGTRVSADQRVSLIAGHSCAWVPNEGTDFCDGVVEQAEPLERWGTEYVLAPFASRQGGDVVRVLANESDTVVAVDGEIVATLAAGQKLDLSRANPTLIRSTRPVSVTQFAKGCKADDDDVDEICNGDPLALDVAPTSAWSTRFVATMPVYALQDFVQPLRHFITIVGSQAATRDVFIDDVQVPAASFTPIVGTDYAFARIERSAGTDRVESALPIAVSVYGFANSEGYGYPAALAPVVGDEPTSDDLVLRLRADGARDLQFAPDGAAAVDHPTQWMLELPGSDRMVRALPDGDGILVGSAAHDVEAGERRLLGYRLLDFGVFRDGFED